MSADSIRNLRTENCSKLVLTDGNINAQKQIKTHSTIRYNDTPSQHFTTEPCMDVQTHVTLKH